MQKDIRDFEELMERYEQRLAKGAYLTGSQISYVDIAVYTELITILTMYQLEVPKNFSLLKKWIEDLG